MSRKRRQSPAAGQREFFARCAGGFEDVLGQELRGLKLQRVRPQVGGAIFFGSLEDAYRACLWSRVATRIQLVLARVAATNAELLYQGVSEIAWEEHVRQGATVAVEAHGENDELRNTKFTALKVKDALCDRLREVRGTRPDVSPHDPDIAINVAVHPRKATIYLNLSGPSLHRRGYRAEGVQSEAPLKETLAAGMLLAAGWPELAASGGVLVDPMCGSGTLAIEAALIAADVAPGLLRQRWGFEGWAQHDAAIWGHVLRSAEERKEQAAHRLRIVAGDIDPTVIKMARDNAQRAGIDDLIRFHVDDAARLKRHLRGVRGLEHSGLLVANPPYGQRLLSRDDLPAVNRALVAAIDALPEGWRVALITPDVSIDTALGRAPQDVITCHNGPLTTYLRVYQAKEEGLQRCEVVSLAGAQRQVPVAEPNSAQFAARLRKQGKERMRWAVRMGAGCFRVYDADLPDYALSVDLYRGAAADEGKRFAIVEERRRPAKVDALRAQRRFADAVALVAAVLDVPAENVRARPWLDPREATRKQGEHASRLPLMVSEGGLLFPLDLNGKPDTGLPLALRGMRELVGREAAGKRIAVLGASAVLTTVYAASSAQQTVTVDAYPDRIDLLREALDANGCAGAGNRLTCTDLRLWITSEHRRRAHYDLVVLVLPAWMPPLPGQGADWQLQRDHAAMLGQLADLLSPDGMMVLAYEGRDLTLDVSALSARGLAVEDVSSTTLPLDLQRSERLHHCWLMRRARA